MVFSLLGYFVSMIMVLTTAVGVMVGLSNFSTPEKVRHYPRPALERNSTATNSKPRLFMSVSGTKDGSPTKNIEASSAVAPDEQAEAKTTRPRKHRAIARRRNNYEGRGYGYAQGYAQETQYGLQRPFSNW